MNPSLDTLSRRAAASDQPRCRADGSGATPTASSTGSPQAGQSWWQMLPLGPPDRARSPYKAPSAFAAWRGLLAEPRRRCQRRRDRAFRAREAFWIADWARVRRRPARGRRPGALRARVGGAARVRPRARRAADRRRADLRRARQRRPPRPAASSSAPARSRARRRTPSRDDGPAVGQPALRLAGAAAPRLPLVDRAPAAHVRALRPRADRPLPRLRRLLGGARRARRDARGGRWRRGPGRAVFDAAARRAGRAAADRRGPRRHHAGRSSACADELGFPGMVVLQFGFDPDDPRRPAPPREPREPTASSTPARTTTTRCAAGGTASTGDPRAGDRAIAASPGLARPSRGGR